jgi:two-component system chemotaxis response regulator CheY
LKILIVDDLEFIRKRIRQAVEKEGFSVCAEADNGLDAVIAYREKKPDAVVLDIAMPIMNGLKALEKIMSEDRKAKVIMCSSMGEDEYLLKAIYLGAKDFVVKPFTSGRLIAAIRKAVMKNDKG